MNRSIVRVAAVAGAMAPGPAACSSGGEAEGAPNQFRPSGEVTHAGGGAGGGCYPQTGKHLPGIRSLAPPAPPAIA